MRIGVSDPTTYDAFSTAIDQARLARDRGRWTRVSHFADVARTGVLSVPPSAEARTVAEAALAPLVRHDREHGTALLDTVRAWLANDCSHEASARALGVHRHTVRARIAAAERALDVDLGSFAARAELWAALRLSS